ncbi:hypothetical protein B6U79_02550 [Candidatus Bathyarchaeota archaeon ex4484_231]|nr:MAG: hypothetical protein B6U79_02550 [Candidatus Bathyarchaeota archaeon ex4484_231]
MPTHPEFQEKIDVLDIIISILKDHEENLSKIIDRFDSVCEDISAFEEKVSLLDKCLERLDGLKIRNVVGAVGTKGPLVTVKCKDWLAFKSASQGALLVAFEVVGDRFFFSSVSDLFIFTYSAGLPESTALMNRRVRGWLETHPETPDEETVPSRGFASKDGEAAYEIVVSPKMVKRWLSQELGIPESKIVEGRILH